MSGTPQTRINEFLSNITDGAIRPQIETLPDGNFLVMYATSVDGPGFCIHGQQFDPDGNPIGEELDFEFPKKIDGPEFDVFVRSNGQVVVAVETDEPLFIGGGDEGLLDGTGIVTSGFDIDEGTAKLVSIPFVRFGSGNKFNPTLAGLDNGDFLVFNTRNALGQDRLELGGIKDNQLLDVDGKPFGGRSDADISTAVLNNGNTVVVLDRDANKGLRSDFDLRFFTPELKQEKLIEIGGGARTFDTTVEALEGGGFAVAWSQLDKVLIRKRKQDTEVFVQVFDENGNATSPKIRVGETRNNDLNTNASIVALEDGGFIVFYDKNRHEPSLNGQRYDADGNAIGDEFRVFEGKVGNIDTTLLADDAVAVSFEANGGIQTEILEFGQVLRGDDGVDILTGGGRDDLIKAAAGDDELRGNNGDDALDGGAGNDGLFAGRGDDTVDGGEGSDTIFGGKGDDTLDGGAGNDQLTGGEGSDTFVFRDGDGQDLITDFDAQDDQEVIDLSDVREISSFGDLAARHMTQQGQDVVIDDGAGLQITLQSVNLADLDANDFVF